MGISTFLGVEVFVFSAEMRRIASMTWGIENFVQSHSLHICLQGTGNMYIVCASGTIQKHVFAGWTSKCTPRGYFPGYSMVRASCIAAKTNPKFWSLDFW